MEKIVRQTLLYDFYGELLTSHQQRIYEDAVFHDLSLSEIAEAQGISRQGVHDLVRRCDRILEDYEEKLHLLRKFSRTRKQIEQIRDLADSSQPAPDERMKQIKALCARILDGL